MTFLPAVIRIVSASVRIIPATIIVGVLGYLGLERAKKYFEPKKEENSTE